MHRKRIIHRDIKSDNILLLDKKDLSVCITDLGMACRVDDTEELKLKCGTPGFVAPEILKQNKCTTKSDIFSLGSLMYLIITRNGLFKGKSVKEILHQNKYSNPQHQISLTVRNVSRECRDLLNQMVSPDPEFRPSAEKCLAHLWFKKDREAL